MGTKLLDAFFDLLHLLLLVSGIALIFYGLWKHDAFYLAVGIMVDADAGIRRVDRRLRKELDASHAAHARLRARLDDYERGERGYRG